MSEYNEELLAEGCEYDAGINDGTSFKDVIFVGTRQRNGKPIMVFSTKDNRQITIKQSYHTYTIEKKMTEMNSVTALQAEDSWSNHKGEH